MKNSLKIKAKIYCGICGCKMNRVKTIKVDATDKDTAIKETSSKVENWKNSLKGQNCKICQSILDMEGK